MGLVSTVLDSVPNTAYSTVLIHYCQTREILQPQKLPAILQTKFNERNHNEKTHHIYYTKDQCMYWLRGKSLANRLLLDRVRISLQTIINVHSLKAMFLLL